ncbi:hypothetical protein [Rhodanobacter hydrolyticus]|uniref:Restriction endonuclease n=1 Tax=Rhodanobacter hydrolyticus TaxID=2250595 RepID=A0ABW8J256_9GAMM
MVTVKIVTMPEDGERLIHQAIAELGWGADPEAVAKLVKRLERGLPAEDEFSVICSWLGKCQLLHKLDQQQVPATSRQIFQVPDLLARFTTQVNDRPVLIEVKSKNERVLSFRPDYLDRLSNYATLVGMPLLIAWKFQGVWTLFEAKHLKKARTNFNISLQEALRQNLLGALVGDVAYNIGKGAGVHFRIRKKKLLSISEVDGEHVENWEMMMEEVKITDFNGNQRTDLTGEVKSLFFAWDLEARQEHVEPDIWVHFVAENEGMQFAHMALVRLLQWESSNEARPDWRSLLVKKQVTRSIADFSAVLEKAMEQHVVYYIFRVRPHEMPVFLSEP